MTENKVALRLVDIGERAFLVLLALPFIAAFVHAIRLHPTLVFVTASELLGVILILTRRGGHLTLATVPVLAAFVGTGLPLLVRPNGVELLPTLFTGTMMWLGLTLSLLAKLYLNRSFGLIAANRGVKIKGPYRLVRHPMYLGYIVTEAGFLLASFTVTNLLLYLVTWTCQILRIRAEEFELGQDEAYREFSMRVRSRLLPGVY